MTARDPSPQLNRIVEKAIEEHNLAKFQEYWNLYTTTFDTISVQGFYIRTEAQDGQMLASSGGYCNVGIVGDGLLIDIEADDRNNSGTLSVQSLKSVSEISFHKGSLQNVARSQGASLVVVTHRTGVEDIGLYWAAKTSVDEERLLIFAKALMQAISKA